MTHHALIFQFGSSGPLWICPRLASATGAILRQCLTRIGEANFRQASEDWPDWLDSIARYTLFHLFTQESYFDSRGLEGMSLGEEAL